MSNSTKISGSRRAHLENRMAEHLGNWNAQRKPKSSGKKVAYDWAKKRVVNLERAMHKPCFGLTSNAARDNYDQIFRRNAK